MVDLVVASESLPTLLNVVHPNRASGSTLIAAFNACLDTPLPVAPLAEWLSKLERAAEGATNADIASIVCLHPLCRNAKLVLRFSLSNSLPSTYWSSSMGLEPRLHMHRVLRALLSKRAASLCLQRKSCRSYARLSPTWNSWANNMLGPGWHIGGEEASLVRERYGGSLGRRVLAEDSERDPLPY